MMALGGCTALDVIPTLAKRKAQIENVEVRISGNVQEEHPQVFTELHTVGRLVII